MNSTTDTQESGLPKIGQPATRALAHIGYVRLEQVATMSERELLAIHGVGPKAVRILREALAERGLAFNEELTRPHAPTAPSASSSS